MYADLRFGSLGLYLGSRLFQLFRNCCLNLYNSLIGTSTKNFSFFLKNFHIFLSLLIMHYKTTCHVCGITIKLPVFLNYGRKNIKKFSSRVFYKSIDRTIFLISFEKSKSTLFMHCCCIIRFTLCNEPYILYKYKRRKENEEEQKQSL